MLILTVAAWGGAGVYGAAVARSPRPRARDMIKWFVVGEVVAGLAALLPDPDCEPLFAAVIGALYGMVTGYMLTAVATAGGGWWRRRGDDPDAPGPFDPGPEDHRPADEPEAVTVAPATRPTDEEILAALDFEPESEPAARQQGDDRPDDRWSA